uniref:Putative conserved secreted protein n=1 Tax=Rhipicephalus microplus TaxID=6941 RepID=A0A6G5A535_RHIMP
MKAAFCVIGLLAALHLPLLAYCFEDFSGAGVETEDHHIGSMKEVVPTPTNAHSSWLPRWRRMPSAEEIAETYHRMKEALRDAISAFRGRVSTIFH